MTNLSTVLTNSLGETAHYKETVKKVNEEGVETFTEKENDWTLGVVLEQALMVQNGETDPDVILKRFKLHKAIFDKKEYKFTPAEKKLVRNLIPISVNPYLAGQSIELLK